MNSERLKHLEFLQQVISRMANNSFLIKGWSLTLLSALLAIALKDQVITVIRVAFIPCVMFWILDAYFLRQERLFRKLFDLVRSQSTDTATTFSMDTGPFDSQVSSWAGVAFSMTLVAFHGSLFVVLAILAYMTHQKLM